MRSCRLCLRLGSEGGCDEVDTIACQTVVEGEEVDEKKKCHEEQEFVE